MRYLGELPCLNTKPHSRRLVWCDVFSSQTLLTKKSHVWGWCVVCRSLEYLTWGHFRLSWKDAQPGLVGSGQLWLWSGPIYHLNTQLGERLAFSSVSLITVKIAKWHQGDLQRTVSAPNTLCFLWIRKGLAIVMAPSLISLADKAVDEDKCW